MEHVDIPPGEVHAPHQWRAANAASRIALAVTVADLGKYCWQQDDHSEWLLVGVSPVVWKQRIGPAGERGEPGATGAAGAAGPQGLKGDAGATGPAGPKGDKGDKGDEGDKGDKGDKGDTGPAGAPGAQGLKGDTGAAGAQGPKGDTGATGPQGLKGDTGAAGPAGADGAQGIQGPKGDTGATGATGATGPAGGAADVAAVTHAATSKATPVDADELPLVDSAGSWGLKRLTWANLKTALQSLFFHRGNILGTVSQTSGVPTGAIVQRGSNANGEFVRFADGTQICTRFVSIASREFLPGGVFTWGDWTFPAAFSVTPSVPHPGHACGYAIEFACSYEWLGLDTVGGITIKNIGTTARTGSHFLSLVAVGRWF